MDNNIVYFLQLYDLQKQNKKSVNRAIQPTINKLLSSFNEEIRTYTKKDTEIVVAKYNENVEWFNTYEHLTTIYNKSGYDIPNMISIKNVGRESNTYLHHIIENWDNLADNTLFTQGNFSHDHKPYPIEVYLIKKNIPFFAHLYKRGVFFRDGNGKHLNHAFKWLDEYNSGHMKHAMITFHEFWNIFSEYKMNYNKLIWSHGAIFSVNKQLIINKPKGFYIYLNNLINTHCNPEEGHYFERCWYYIFNTIISPNNKLYELFSLLEQNYEIKKTNELNKTYWNNLNKIDIFMLTEEENKKIRDNEEKKQIEIKREEERLKRIEYRRQIEEDKIKKIQEDKIRELKIQEEILHKKQQEYEELEKNRLQIIKKEKDKKEQIEIKEKEIIKKKIQKADEYKAMKLKQFLEYKHKLKKMQIEKEKEKELQKLKKIQQKLKKEGISFDDFYEITKKNIEKMDHDCNDYNNLNYDDSDCSDDNCDRNEHDSHMSCSSNNEDIYLKNIGIKETNVKKIFENDLYSIGKI